VNAKSAPNDAFAAQNPFGTVRATSLLHPKPRAHQPGPALEILQRFSKIQKPQFAPNIVPKCFAFISLTQNTYPPSRPPVENRRQAAKSLKIKGMGDWWAAKTRRNPPVFAGKTAFSPSNSPIFA
jgi:hypothetical protein